MPSRVVTGLAVALSLALPAGAADASRGHQQSPRRIHTRSQGGPSALGGVTGSHAGEMARVQQQRARRGAAAGARGMSPREQLLAARDRQLAGEAQVGFTSRQQAAATTRARARLTQMRTFAVAIATGFGGGFLAKMVTAIAALQAGGYRDPLSDPSFGNPIAQMFDHHFLIGAVIGAGISLVIGSVRAAQLRSRAGAIERGEVDVDLAHFD